MNLSKVYDDIVLKRDRIHILKILFLSIITLAINSLIAIICKYS